MLPSYLTQSALYDLIYRALREDVGAGDVTTLATVRPDAMAEGHFVAKEGGVLAGLRVTECVFQAVDDRLETSWAAEEGSAVQKGARIGTVRGPARSILTAERLSLNLMQRMSGIATAARQMVNAVKPYKAKILDTRKTAPGLRLLDKWAVKLGGGENHRIGLYDMILIKDNHITAAGGIHYAIDAAVAYKEAYGLPLQIEVEVRTLDEIQDVLETGEADFILLDNMARMKPDGTVDVSLLAAAVQAVDGRIFTEASGNVTIDTVTDIAATGVDFISCGALTHSVRAMDISLKIHL